MIIENGYYKHYKGNIYKVIGVGKHSETLEDMVIYQSVKTNEIWVRPYLMFIEDVTLPTGVVKRFEYLGERL